LIEKNVMSDMCLAGKNKKRRKIVKNIFLFFWIKILYFMFVGAERHKKIKKKLFFNYFLLYLVVIIVIIELYTKNILLIESVEPVLALTHSYNWSGEGSFKYFLIQASNTKN
jgi:hypothetical protein